MNGEWKIKIVDSGYRIAREVFIFRRLPMGKIEILGDQKTQTIVDEGAAVEPSLLLEPEQLQAFADALADNGFKPKEGFMEGKLEATEKHLEDMRKLVFKV